MHAQASKRIPRKLAVLISAVLIAACGTGDGPERLPGTPATPLPPIPPGFCDVINFEVLCPPVTIINFNGGATTVIENPDMSGINTSDLVARMQKFPDETFGGTKLDLGAPIDFADGEAFTVKVWSPRNVALTFKLDEQNKERVQNHSGSSTWEELCFDFSGDTAGAPNPGLTLIFDNGTLGQADTDPANWTFFYDDVAQVADCGGGGGPPAGGTPITPDNVVFATDPNLVVDLPPPVIDNFGSGAVFDFTFAGDPDYNPALQITSGEGYGAGVHVGFVALTGYAAGFAANYENVVFKVKGDAANLTSFEVKFIEGGTDTSVLYDLTTYAGSESLGNDWWQVSIPMTDFAATIAANAGFLLGPAGGQAAAFTLLLTDIGFTGTVAVGGTPITPEAVVFATDPNIVEDLAPPGVDNFGSGAVFDFMFAGDADYNPAIQATSGEGYGAGVHVAFVAFTGYAAGFADGYENFVFKVKGDAANLASFEAKFIGGTDTSMLYDLTNYSGSESLGNGWWQVSIPMTDFAANIAVNDGFLLGPAGGQAAPFSFLMTDIGFTGTAGGGGGTGVVVNGDFETGDLTGWDVFVNGGTITPDNTENNGGMWSVHVVAGPGNNPVLKQSFLFPGVVVPGGTVNISFDMKGSAAAGGIVFPELISEGAGGAAVGNLLDTIAAPTADWTTYNYSPVAGADVTGGVTFQLAIVCGADPGCSNDVFIDNVTVTLP